MDLDSVPSEMDFTTDISKVITHLLKTSHLCLTDIQVRDKSSGLTRDSTTRIRDIPNTRMHLRLDPNILPEINQDLLMLPRMLQTTPDFRKETHKARTKSKKISFTKIKEVSEGQIRV